MRTDTGPGRKVGDYMKNVIPPKNVEPEYVRGSHFYACLWLDSVFKYPIDPRVTESEIARLVEIRNSLSDIDGVLPAVSVGRTMIEPRATGMRGDKLGLKDEKRKWLLMQQKEILQEIHDRGFTVYDRGIHNLFTDGEQVTMIDFYDIYRHGKEVRAWEDG